MYTSTSRPTPTRSDEEEDRFCCPTCRQSGIVTVLARQVREGQSEGTLLRSRASRIFEKAVGEGRMRRTEIVLVVKCPRCKTDHVVPGRLWRRTP